MGCQIDESFSSSQDSMALGLYGFLFVIVQEAELYCKV